MYWEDLNKERIQKKNGIKWKFFPYPLVYVCLPSFFRSASTSYRTFDVRPSRPSVPSVRPSRPSVPSVRPVRKKNQDHLYSLINHRRTTVNLPNHIFCEN